MTLSRIDIDERIPEKSCLEKPADLLILYESHDRVIIVTAMHYPASPTGNSRLRELDRSRFEDVVHGANEWTAVDLLSIETLGEAEAIRFGLEQMGIRVNLFRVGQVQHIVRALGNPSTAAPFVIMSAHGDDGRFTLPSLAPEVAARQQFNEKLSGEDLASFVDLPGRVVISTACTTGNEVVAKAFLSNGAEAFIGPTDEPYGYSGYLFPVLFFYELTEGRTLKQAVNRITSYDSELCSWKLFD